MMTQTSYPTERPLAWYQPLWPGCWGVVMVVLALVASANRLEVFLNQPLDRPLLYQLWLIRYGLLVTGGLFLGWTVLEYLTFRSGPQPLWMLIAWVPLLYPLAWWGYGWDPDAWWVAWNGYLINQTGEYHLSRPPGFPLHELLAALLVPLGQWPLMLAANLVAGLSALVGLAGLSHQILPGKRRLIMAAVACHPLFILATGTGLDYIWQTALIIWALVFLSKLFDPGCSRQLCWALCGGLLLGIAVGFRLTSLLLVLPFSLLVWCAPLRLGQRWWCWAGFVTSVVLTTAVVESPVYLTAGLAAFRVYPDYPLINVVVYRVLRLGYTPPLILMMVAGTLWTLWKWPQLSRYEQTLWSVSVVSVGLVTMAYLMMPVETGYLTLLVPFWVIIYALAMPRWWQIVAVAGIAVWGYLSVPVIQPQPGLPVLAFHPVAGPLVEEVRQRTEQQQRCQQVLMTQPRHRTAVVVGFDWPILATLRPEWVSQRGVMEHPEAPVSFHWFLGPEELAELKAQNARIEVVGNAARFTLAKHEIDLFAEGARAWRHRNYFIPRTPQP